MKADRARVERALATADATIRLCLLYGPDESGSRALAALLGKAIGADAERVDLAPAALKGDPALLADEAASRSLFGGARWIRVEGAGEESLAAVEALLDAGVAGNPVAIVAGALRRESKLLKRVLAAPNALAFASYPPEGGEADRLVVAMARERGVRIDRDAAQIVARNAAGDRAVLAGEVEKLALYLDAAPDRPRDADLAAVAAIGADSGDAEISRLVDAVLDGNPARAAAELARLAGEGVEGIPLLRAVLRALNQLAPMRAEVDAGASVETMLSRSGKSLSGKQKDSLARQLERWSGDAIALAIERMAASERVQKASGGPGPVAADADLLALARFAARQRRG